MPTNPHHPYHPIIYVRGFAGTQGEIEDTVADPYMGFNIGSTKSRVLWTGKVRKFFFESPIVRLKRNHGYDDVYLDGEDLVLSTEAQAKVPYRCVVIYRYYDEASDDFGSGKTPPIEHFATGLGNLIVTLREKICANPANGVAPEDFRVYLVAHSMGGLICRAFLQNRKLGPDEARRAVDKLFTYATPHNGIDMRVVRNVPGWASLGDVNNFNRQRMADYLGLPPSLPAPPADDVSVVLNFPPERVFNLVGTNPADYLVLRGLSSWAVGDRSDGLVRIDNATTHGPDARGGDVQSPRAFVHRSHSGYFGIVNSEEGYQNLTRFLFGTMRVDGILDIDAISLPAEVQKECDAGRQVRASYQFEIVVSVRGGQWQIHRRTVQENSPIFREYDKLFPRTAGGGRTPDRAQGPHLFSVFLDQRKSVATSKSVSFALDLNVLVPDYEIDGALFLTKHYEGGYIYRDLIIVEAAPDPHSPGGWRIRYGYQDRTPGAAEIAAPARELPGHGGIAFDIDVVQTGRPGIAAKLRIEARPWNEGPR